MGKIMYNDIDFSGADIVEITQADYDALPSTKYYDDITYLITDVYTPSSTKNVGLGECYSLSEKQIGCWTDGKPLYQKTIHIPSVIYDTNWHTHNHNISNIDKITNVFGVLVSSGHYIYPASSYRAGTTYGITIETGVTEISYINNWVSDSDYMDVTIQYTKTTDTAGSGNWTPEGVPTHHYSTDEQIIGTYLGETLYEKTINSTLNLSGSWQNYFDMSNKNLVDVSKVRLKRDGEICSMAFSPYQIVSYIVRDNYLKFCLQTSGSYDPYVLYSATVQYTKTS